MILLKQSQNHINKPNTPVPITTMSVPIIKSINIDKNVGSVFISKKNIAQNFNKSSKIG